MTYDEQMQNVLKFFTVGLLENSWFCNSAYKENSQQCFKLKLSTVVNSWRRWSTGI